MKAECVQEHNLRGPGRARFYEVFEALKDVLEMMARSLYLATTRVVALHLPRFYVGSSTNQTRGEEA
jgi:hypothetical protein